MSTPADSRREGSLEAPRRSPLDWKSPEFYDEARLFDEMSRVFDICHGCRRCFSLCNAFPTLFDAIDDSPAMELDGVERQVYWRVVDHCYLCDMCFMTKCPYVPPHPWNVDFPQADAARPSDLQLKKWRARARRDRATVSSTQWPSASSPAFRWWRRSSTRYRDSRRPQAMIEVAAGCSTPCQEPPSRSEYHSKPAQARRARPAPARRVRPVHRHTGSGCPLLTCYGN